MADIGKSSSNRTLSSLLGNSGAAGDGAGVGAAPTGANITIEPQPQSPQSQPQPTAVTAAKATAQKLKTKIRNEQQNQQQRVYNPRWLGYTYILVTSLINMSAVSNVNGDEKSMQQQLNNYYYDYKTSSPSYQRDLNKAYVYPSQYRGNWACNVTFGVVTFTYAFLVLLFDRTGLGIPIIANENDSSKNKKNNENNSGSIRREVYNYTTVLDGKLEGYCLLFNVIWWIIGVSYQTQVNGIAYLAMNIYFSSWLSLIACIYTLEKWSHSKDILSFQELTGLSLTLRSWYILFLSSLILTGTSINLLIILYGNNQSTFETNDYSSSSSSTRSINYLAIDSSSPASIGLAFGIISTILSCIFILLHYNLIDCYGGCTEGSWWELTASITLVLMWIIGVATITQHGGIGATVMGMPYTNVFLPNATTVTLLNSIADYNNSSDYVPNANNININAATMNYIAYTATTTPQNDLIVDNTDMVPYYADNITTTNNITNDTEIINNMHNDTNISNDTTYNETMSNDNSTIPPVHIVDSIIESTCQLLYYNTNITNEYNETIRISFPCYQFIPTSYIHEYTTVPGSNMYIFVWLCLLASLNISFRWKAQQALSFAQAQQEKAFAQMSHSPMMFHDDDDDADNINTVGSNNNNSNNKNNNKYGHDDDNDDRFLDADMY